MSIVLEMCQEVGLPQTGRDKAIVDKAQFLLGFSRRDRGCLLGDAIFISIVVVNAVALASDALQPSRINEHHSFIPEIYIAPLQEAYSEALMYRIGLIKASCRSNRLIQLRHCASVPHCQAKASMKEEGDANDLCYHNFVILKLLLTG